MADNKNIAKQKQDKSTSKGLDKAVAKGEKYDNAKGRNMPGKKK